MRNVELQPRARNDIDRQVEKVLRGLGNPEPPLSLANVRAALELDLRYYSKSETGTLAETAHRMRVGVRQVLLRPALLVDVVRKLNLKALYVPDRKRILIDADEPPLKHRWSEAHEIGHSIIPWHGEVLHGDNKRTLKPACHHAIEAEANYAAGRLLFLQERFGRELLAGPLDVAAVKRLQKRFGNTLTTTLWRAVEQQSVPAVGMVSVHPQYTPEDFDWVNPCRYFVRSPAFAARFSNVTELATFGMIQTYCGWRKRGPLGESEMSLVDDNGEAHEFRFESSSNTYDTLTLAVYRRKHAPVVAV